MDSGTSTRRPNATEVRDAQRAADAALQQRGQVVGVLDLVRDGLALVVVQRADLGRAHAARRAVQQARAQALLHRGHGLGGGGLGDAEVGRGLAEAAGLDDADEEGDGGDAVHGPDGSRARPSIFHHGIAKMPRPVFTPGPARRTITPSIAGDPDGKDEGRDGRGAGDGEGRRDPGLRRARRGHQPAVRGAARARHRSPTCWRATSRAPRTWPRATRGPRPATSACASAPRARPAPT